MPKACVDRLIEQGVKPKTAHKLCYTNGKNSVKSGNSPKSSGKPKSKPSYQELVMATKLNKRQKELIAEIFDPPKAKPTAKATSTAGSRKRKLAMQECPASYGYLKKGKCVPHKEAKSPEKASVAKSVSRGLRGKTRLQKKYSEAVKKDLANIK